MSNVVLRMRRIKEIIAYVFCVIIGIGAVIAGIVMLNNDGEVDCGGHKMSAGEKCVTTSKRGSTTRDLEEQKSSNTKAAWGMIIFGPLFFGAGAFMLSREVRNARRPKGGGAQANFAAPQPNPAQPGFPPGQQFGHPAPQYAPQPGYPAPQNAPQPGYPAPQNGPQPGQFAPQHPQQPGYPNGPQPGYPNGPHPGYPAPQHPGYPAPQYAAQPGYPAPQHTPAPQQGYSPPPQGYPQPGPRQY
ncbi:hypothetical protein BJY24_002358 [Nocardia transvalensis]|uniref:Uncharacterized protein n=1 Tax=Nocardia transvalensis TaxID=37333 RepID=A0A7W9PCP4_9NOCA|nr:hypothetical protein [Nocardia transvalensis]MBB5913491.1 hypothetical protein [Nocardia transvalensis]